MSRKKACENELKTSERLAKLNQSVSRKRACENDLETSERRAKSKRATAISRDKLVTIDVVIKLK